MTTRKKILVLASTYPRFPDDAEPGFVKSLCERLSIDHDVLVLAPGWQGNGGLAQEEDLRVYRYRYAPAFMERLAYEGGIMAKLRASPWLILSVPFFLIAQVLVVVRLLRQEQFDVVHAHWLFPQGWVAIIALLFTRRPPPLLVTSHGGDFYGLQSSLFRRIKRRVVLRSTKTAVVSRAMMHDIVAETGVPAESVCVAPMGVDLSGLFSGGIHARREGVVFVGRLVEKKGVGVLLEAMHLLNNKGRGVAVTVAGDGPLRRELEIAARGLDVTFTGALSPHEVAELLSASSVAVIPSCVGRDGDQEGLGLTGIEAMGAGCAVIGSDLRAMADYLHDQETALVFPAEDSVALAAAIERLLNDEALRLRLAAAGQQFVRSEYDWPATVDRYRALYRELIN